MAYTKTEWKERQGANLNRFAKSQETAETVILTNTPDEVTEQGTPVTPQNMNKIENGIYEAHQQIDAINGKIPAQASEINQLADKAFVISNNGKPKDSRTVYVGMNSGKRFLRIAAFDPVDAEWSNPPSALFKVSVKGGGSENLRASVFFKVTANTKYSNYGPGYFRPPDADIIVLGCVGEDASYELLLFEAIRVILPSFQPSLPSAFIEIIFPLNTFFNAESDITVDLISGDVWRLIEPEFNNNSIMNCSEFEKTLKLRRGVGSSDGFYDGAGKLRTVPPAPPTGTYTLKSVNGVMTWVSG